MTLKLNKISLFISSLFYFIVSFLLFIFAPHTYSHLYCIILLIVYVISSVLTIRHTVINKNYFNFHVLFLISFFFVNFVYPVFIYPVDPFHFSVFRKYFDHNIITKATALALVGSNAYTLGVSMQFKDINKKFQEADTNIITLQFLSTTLLYTLFLGLLYFGGMNLIKGKFYSTSNIPPGLLTLFEVLIGLSVILFVNTKSYNGTIIDFINKFSIPVLLIFILYFLIFIFTGDRGPVIQITLITILVFSIYVKPIKLKSLIIVTLAGMFFLTFISYARIQNKSSKDGTGVTISKGLKNFRLNTFFDLGMDLIVCNRNLYVGYDYANTNGLNYGKSMFFYIVAPIPMLPGFLTHVFFNSTPDELSSAKLITKKSKSTYGLGTNMIADLYMAFGLIGVIFFMVLLGYIITICQRKAIYSNNLNFIIAYAFFISLSIYLPRTTIWEPFRHIIWAIVILNLLKALRISHIRFSNKI